jgi:hypothetical protein
VGNGQPLTVSRSRPPARPGSIVIPAALLFLATLAAHLLVPGRVLAVRDIAQLHLPLRVALVRLLAQGIPSWNPWMSGGQPVLSDPSYSAFYPSTWLALVVSPGGSLSLHAFLHLGIAFAGAWRLARGFGCRPSTALFAAIAYAGGGVVVSFAWALNDLPGAAWLPWVLHATRATVVADSAGAARRGVLGLAATLGLVFLNGEPVTASCCCLASGVLALALGRGRALLRVAMAGVGGVALGAIQLLPALDRLRASARSQGLSFDEATTWSSSPLRALELVFPRLFGDPATYERGLYFGWGVHDLDFPFLPSIFPGIAVLIFAIAGLAARPIPARAAWISMAALGGVLALGRYTPVYGLLHAAVPPFGSIRYPEKFALLVAVSLALSAALALEHWLAEREAGRRGAGDLPLAIGGVLLAVSVAGVALAYLAPQAISAWVVEHSAFAPGPVQLERALELYRAEALWSAAWATATIAVLAIARAGRLLAAGIAVLLATLLGGELVRVHRPLLPTRPLAAFEPGANGRALLDRAGRVWASATFDRRPELIALGGDPAARALARSLDRLEPWTGLTWGLSYGLSADFASSFTAPLRRAVDCARSLGRGADSERLHRLLGAWGVAHLAIRTPAEEIAAALAAGRPEPPAARLRTNPFALSHFRFVGSAESYGDPDVALARALESGLSLHQQEYLVRAPWSGRRDFDAGARVLAADDRANEIELAVATSGEALLVVANTFDSGWSAESDGRAVPVYETGAGYQAVPLSAGTRRVVLRYRERWLPAGAAISVAAWLTLAGFALAVRPRGTGISSA